MLPLSTSSHVPGSRPGAVSERLPNRFRGIETRSVSPTRQRCCFAVRPRVSDGTDRQALAGLSWLSFSRFPVFSENPRVWSKTRSRLLPGRELPTPARLNGPDRTFTRVAASNERLWSGPPAAGLRRRVWRRHLLHWSRPLKTASRFLRFFLVALFLKGIGSKSWITPLELFSHTRGA